MAKRGRKPKTTEQFITDVKLVHGDKYDYSETVYEGSLKKIKIICNKCGLHFTQRAQNHLHKKDGCPKCARVDQESFIEQAKEIHKDKYLYNEVEYKGLFKKVKIYCRECGKYFEQTPNHHLYDKTGCPVCRRSKGELAVADYLDNRGISYEIEYSFMDLVSEKGYPLRFDFYLPEHQVLIEFDGPQHKRHIKGWIEKSAYTSQQYNDGLKNKYAEDNNFNLIRIEKIPNIPKKLAQFQA